MRSQAIHINAICLCDGRQEIFLAGEVVDRQGSFARSQVLAVIHCHFCRELSFDGGSPLEFVIDLNAQAPPGFFELCGNIGCPLSCMSSELSHLRNQVGRRKERELALHCIFLFLKTVYVDTVAKKKKLCSKPDSYPFLEIFCSLAISLAI